MVRYDAKLTHPILFRVVHPAKIDGLPVKVENFSASGTFYCERPTTWIINRLCRISIFYQITVGDALGKGQQTFLTNEGISTAKNNSMLFSPRLWKNSPGNKGKGV